MLLRAFEYKPTKPVLPYFAPDDDPHHREVEGVASPGEEGESGGNPEGWDEGSRRGALGNPRGLVDEVTPAGMVCGPADGICSSPG